MTCQAFQEHQAQRVDVAFWRQVQALRLLRAEVLRRANSESGRGEAVIVHHQGDPKVRQLHRLSQPVVVGHQDVGRLDVTVDDAVFVDLGQGSGDPDPDPRGFGNSERPVGQEGTQVPPLGEFHDQVGTFFVVARIDARVKGCHQSGMVEGSEEAHFGFLAGAERFVAGAGKEDLYSNLTAKDQVSRLMDSGHRAAAQEGSKLVAAIECAACFRAVHGIGGASAHGYFVVAHGCHVLWDHLARHGPNLCPPVPSNAVNHISRSRLAGCFSPRGLSNSAQTASSGFTR
ncbi:hypothetical protein PJL18_04242 [Paenarthrobacter nicotinovorans]|nr:hypothetical protein [Paenarthrobacter nicotinovorans]